MFLFLGFPRLALLGLASSFLLLAFVVLVTLVLASCVALPFSTANGANIGLRTVCKHMSSDEDVVDIVSGKSVHGETRCAIEGVPLRCSVVLA